MEKILKRLKDLIYEIDNDRETINGISNELYEIIQALQLLQTDVSMQSEPFISLIKWLKNHKKSEKLYRETPECIVKYYFKEINGY